ncbi:hypothetical protein N0V95_009041 [Ascochyta clinopodiicola]|nr:hypothetical protein N0V95_009041 [Ascochyta clinopodiicola]
MTPSAQSKDSDDVPQMTETVAVKELRDGNESPEIISAFANWSRSACIKTFWRLYLTGLLVSTGGMYVGYLVSAVGNIIANQGFIDAFATVTDPQTGKPALDANHVALWGAINFAAQIFIQMIAPFTADRWGRKFNMWLLTFFLSVSIVLSIVAKNWIVYTIAKMFGGFAAGLLGSSIMIYMSEITMPQFRGALLSSFSLMFSLGQVFLAVGLKILQETDMLKFRNIFYSEFVFCGLWLFPMIYLPETPVWLAGQGKHDQGKRALRRLVGNVDGFDIDHEYAVIEQEVEASVKLSKLQNNTDNAWKAFLSRKNMKRTIVAALPLTFQNFVGVPLVFGYKTQGRTYGELDELFDRNVPAWKFAKTTTVHQGNMENQQQVN